MSDDLLNQFTKALAEEYDGATAVPEASRARIIRTLAERKPRQKKWLVVGIPLFALLGGSTAWAAASGQLRPIVEQAAVVLGIVEPPPAPAENPQVKKGHKGSGVKLEQDAADKSPETDPIPSDEPTTEPEVSAAEHTAPSPEVAVAQKPALLPPTKTDEESAAELLRKKQEQERAQADAKALAAYRAGHDAQFARGDCKSAVTAYQNYLTNYPGGSFAPEARYNRGVCLANLGRNAEARLALEPFAAGDYGTYRQTSAQALIDALP